MPLGVMAGHFFDVLGLAGDGSQARQYQLPQRREPCAASTPMDQRTAKFALQLLDGGGQRWLRHPASSCSTGKTALLDQCEEVANLMKFHLA